MHERRHEKYQRQLAKKRRRGCAPRPWTFVVLILALGIGIYAVVSGNTNPEFITDWQPLSRIYSYNEIIPTATPNPATATVETRPTSTLALPMVPISTQDIVNTGYLSLVNHQHKAPSDPAQELLVSAWPTVAVSRIEGMYLHNSALRAVSEMFDSARDQNVSGFFVSSAFRDFDHQANLYGDGSNSAYVMPPGHSEHQTGLAADILVTGIGMHEMANVPEGLWLQHNSYRYGLILRYPQGAEGITGINFEPWHFRYVGQVHAYYMTKRGFVLEEYIDYINNHGQLSFEKNGETHHIFVQSPVDGMIYVPYGRQFTVSCNNKGDYIIWTTE